MILPLRSMEHKALVVEFANSNEEIRETQRLRYEVFAKEYGAYMAPEEEPLDRDHFDAYCDHLVVRDRERCKIVGTCCILPWMQARNAGGFYSQMEFNLSRLMPLCPRLVEVGRSCVHPDYRHGAAIALLWSGLARYVMARGFEYMMGCASISTVDGGTAARSAYQYLKVTCLSPAEWRVVPYEPFSIDAAGGSDKIALPPLIKGCARSGAYVCGEPAWDQKFRSADLLMLLPLSRMELRYPRYFFGRSVAGTRLPHEGVGSFFRSNTGWFGQSRHLK
jgi:putative hemolysin